MPNSCQRLCNRTRHRRKGTPRMALCLSAFTLGLGWNLQPVSIHVSRPVSRPFNMVNSQTCAVIRCGKPGPDTRSGEAAGGPRHRTQLPDDMMGDVQGQGISMSGLGIAIPNFNYAVHHHHASCIVWDCGNGLVKTMSYAESFVWA